MSIRLNTLSNYLGQGYTIIIALVITPLYLKHLGAEAYGLVGFFVVMQTWLNLLDMGLSTTLGRQVAYARGQINGFHEFPDLLRGFELIFITITSGIIATVFLGSDWLSRSWIKSNELATEDISYCITLMGVIIGIRFFSTIYRSGINGFEDQVWVNKFGIGVTSLKYIGSLIILIQVSTSIRHFFEYQLVIGTVETVVLARRFRYNLPKFPEAIAFRKVDWRVLRGILPFSLGIAYTSATLIAVTQFDKLLLSGLLPLDEFGYFSVVALIAGSIMNLSTPVFLSFLPRMTMLVSMRKTTELIALYKNLTQIITWISITAAIFIGTYSQEILYALTGDKAAYTWGGEILFWYALGSGIYVMGTFQYYLQNAFGSLRIYVISSTLALLLQIPLVYIVSHEYGALGAGRLWFLFSSIWFLGCTAVVHRKLIPKFHVKWLLHELLPIIIVVVALSLILQEIDYVDLNETRMQIALKTSIIGLSFFAATSLSVPLLRRAIWEKITVRQ